MDSIDVENMDWMNSIDVENIPQRRLALRNMSNKSAHFFRLQQIQTDSNESMSQLTGDKNYARA